MLYAHPQLNGNDPQHFIAAATVLHEARNKLAEAIQIMHANVLHGRNYQHTLQGNRSHDTNQLDPLVKAIEQLDSLMSDVVLNAGPS